MYLNSTRHFLILQYIFYLNFTLIMSKLKANDVGLNNVTQLLIAEIWLEHRCPDPTLKHDQMTTKGPSSLKILFLLPLQFYLYFYLLRVNSLVKVDFCFPNILSFENGTPFPLIFF